MSTYNNPVLRGFYPDPSIVRVNDDFYMVNSSFHYFPAIPIHHSKDLVHWELIGHAICENDFLDLSNISDSHGIWAPDISYYNGEFYIFATLRLNDPPENTTGRLRQTLFMKSKKPEGPYSKPAVLDIDNIDSVHFADDDGTHYCVTAPGVTITKLSDDCCSVAGETVNIWPGTGLRCPEGPHVLKKDGYYYAYLAEGGTGFGHRVSVGRSRSLFGPYEESPYNPVLKQTDKNAVIQRSGHCDLVETQNGEWWAVYLCGRQNEGPYCTIGRETALDKVTWTDDGWFIINDLKGPSTENICPNLPETIYEKHGFDDFDTDKFSFEWEFVRNPHLDKIFIEKDRSMLVIKAGEYDLNDRKAYNIILRRETEHKYCAVTNMFFKPSKNGEQAGITCYYGIYNHIKCCVVYDEGIKVRVYENRNNVVSILGEKEINNYNGQIYLMVRVLRQTREFFYSFDNKNWILVGRAVDCSFLCDEGVTIGKHHTGTLVGLYAYDGKNNTNISAEFDWFDYKVLEK